MKAAVRERYGSPDVVEIRELATPVPSTGEVLVRVRASSVNAADWYVVAGQPLFGRVMTGIRRPKKARTGSDFAGTVEAAGKGVEEFRPGDEVFGGKAGAYAEYVCVAHDGDIVAKPANITFEQAGTIGIAGLTALQGLRDRAPCAAGTEGADQRRLRRRRHVRGADREGARRGRHRAWGARTRSSEVRGLLIGVAMTAAILPGRGSGMGIAPVNAR